MTLLVSICAVLATLAVFATAFAIDRLARRTAARVGVLLLARSQGLRPALAAGGTPATPWDARPRQGGGES